MPGETEGYKCVGVPVTSDEYLTGFRLVSPSPAQHEMYLTVATNVTDGPSDCSPGALGGELIYASSVGTGPLEFPSGFGVHVLAGEHLFLNIHVDNAADTSVADSTRIEARIGTAADVTTPVDMTEVGTFLINIPSDGQVHTAVGTCPVGNVHVLALLPLMRSTGVHQTITVSYNDTPQTVFDKDFDLQHNSYTELATPFQIGPGGKITTLCSYVNSSGSTKTYGETSGEESCFNALYRYPPSTGGNFYGCAEGQNFDIRPE